MPRSARLLVEDQPTVYHVMSRTCLPGLPLGDVEKEFLLDVIKRFSRVYFSEILGFCLMGNHFHLLVRMQSESAVPDEEVARRCQALWGGGGQGAQISARRIVALKQKWTNLSSFVAEIKQTFSRFYNRRHGRKGYFWGGRFKSVIVQDGRTLVNCLAYIDLNPIRAGIARRPEDYRWCSLGYHLGSGNAGDFLSQDFGLADWDVAPGPERLRLYREFVYRTGALESARGKALDARLVERENTKDFKYSQADRFLMRTRWFTDSAIIGSKTFVSGIGKQLGLANADKRKPRAIDGLDFYSFRRLSELI